MKPFYTSKTLWFNALAAIITFLQVNQALLPENVAKFIPIIVLVGNLLLPFDPKRAPLKLKGKDNG